MSHTLLVEALGIVEEIFELPESERQALVARRCAGRPELLAAIEEIETAPLESDNIPSLRSVIDDLLPSLSHEPAPDPLPGAIIGRYRVGEKIGEGGMGRVYRAVHTGHGGAVAFKVLQAGPGRDSTRMVRLRHEANLLARCHHAGIVQIHDLDSLPPPYGPPGGGTYFTMELVDGLPLTEFCTARSLSFEARLRLFLQVCEAVQAAHDVGVIHRDLKPSNIVANAQGVKLLDFGIAETFGDTEALCRAYMSGPYSAPDHLDETTTRTDVYSLGVLLAEMLLHRLPFNLVGETPAEQRRSALEDERPPLRQLADPSTCPWLRRVSRLRWAELQSICDKALQPDPARRYGAVKDLASDIDSLLQSRPVAAQREARSAGYRFYTGWRFVRRHALGAGATAALVLLSSAALVSYTYALRQSRDAARKEKHSAEQQRRHDELVTGMFMNGDGSLNSQAMTTSLLERAIHQAEIIDIDPEQKAMLFKKFGAYFQMKAEYPRADQLFQQSLALNSHVYGADSPEAADIMLQRSNLVDAEGDPQAGLSLAQQARASLVRKLPATDTRVLEADVQMSECLIDLGEYEAAKPLLENALLRLPRDPDATNDLSIALNDLSDDENYLGNYEHALALQQQTMAIDKLNEGPRHPDIGEHLISISNTYAEMGEPGQATSAAREAVSILSGSLGPDHHDVLAAENHLANSLLLQGNFSEAETFFKNALEGLAREKHRSQTEAVASLQYGDLLRKRGQLQEALQRYQRSFAITKQLFPSANHFWATSYFSIAAVYHLMGNQPDAEKPAREALKLDLALFGPSHVRTLQANVLLARILIAQHRYSEAQLLLEQTERLSTTKDGPDRQVLSDVNELLSTIKRDTAAKLH